MTKIYEVKIIESEIYVITDIEAENEYEAQEKAWELLTGEDSENVKQTYYIDSDGESEVSLVSDDKEE